MNALGEFKPEILIVDDTPQNLKLIGTILRGKGFGISFANSGSEALEIIKEVPPALILLDVLMPEMDGYETCRRLKSEPGSRDIPVIFLSALTETVDKVRGFRAGAVDYITKPVDQSELLSRINTHLMLRELQKNLEKTVSIRTGELLKSEKKYRTLADNIPGMVYRAKPDWSLAIVFNSFELCGYPPEELLSGHINWLNLIHPDDKENVLKEAAELLEKPASLVQQYRIISGDGTELWMEDYKTSFFSEKNQFRGVDGIVFDITERKRSEEQLRQSQKMEIVGTLAGGLAHDFNNVLGGIMGPLSILDHKLRNKQEIPVEKLSEYIQAMRESSRRAAEMVKQLLTLSRKQEMAFSPVDLSQTINRVMKICRNTFDKSVKLVAYEFPEPAMTKADPTQIEQILLNFCVNACHAMTIMRKTEENWGGELTVSLDAITADQFFCRMHPEAELKRYWMMTVKDTGIGMNANTISKIFNPFFTTKETGTGTGLGLAMVYNIVKQHHGFIDVYSEEGVGTTFNTYLPVLEEKFSREESVETKKAIPKGNGLILVVDDEPITRDITRILLRECGYEFLSAENGAEGTALFEAHKDELSAVLLDMSMPVMAGKEAFIRMNAIDPNVKVILTSGFKQDERVNRLIDMGVSDFIQKPYTLEKMATTLHNVISGKEKTKGGRNADENE
jgi:PAS domain S-box-containing protein